MTLRIYWGLLVLLLSGVIQTSGDVVEVLVCRRHMLKYLQVKLYNWNLLSNISEKES